MRWPASRPVALVAAAVLLATLLPLGQPTAARAATAVSGLYLDSIGHDLVGPGVPTYYPGVMWDSYSDGSGITGITVDVFGTIGAPGSLHFAAPGGQHLAVGVPYTGGVDAGTCQQPDASGFTLHELEDGFDKRLALSFWVECFTGMSIARGEIRSDSSVPFRALTLGAMSVAFASTPAGTPGETRTIAIGSAGNEPLTVASVSLDRPADFTVVSEACTAAPIATGSSCDVVVQFTPQNGGLRTAGLVIDDDTTRGSHVIALSGTAVGPASGIAWGSVLKAGPAYAWNDGGALGRTVQSGTQRLHLAYATNRIGSAWAKDRGPYLGIYYTRSTSGSTWSTPKRLNPTSQHATRVGLAAAGSRVYVTWATQKSIRDVPDAARVVYVRVNTSHGAAANWKAAIRLTSTTGRVDYPVIAAAGTDVVIAWTDSVTGSIRVAVSHDRGVTWKKSTIGTASTRDESGRVGLPSVTVAGPVVAVAWRADAAGTVKARISANRGVTWGATETVGSGQRYGAVSVAARGTRVAVAWLTRAEVVARLRVAGTWGLPSVITGLDVPETVVTAGAPAIVLQDPARVAVSWSEELQSGGNVVRWAESADGGVHWFATQTPAAPASGRTFNDAPSVLWPSAGTRYVCWTGATGTSYRLFLRRATGTP